MPFKACHDAARSRRPKDTMLTVDALPTKLHNDSSINRDWDCIQLCLCYIKIMFQHYYSEFLKRNQGVQHFSCHSHHFWPDITRQAMLDYWEDSACLSDRKWEKILNDKVPSVQKLIAKNLNFSRPQDICFASNTHDFLIRLLSCFENKKHITILTSDSEFYSFERQIRRLEETGWVKVVRVPSEPYHDFEFRFTQTLAQNHWDMVFLSHVFFNSGVAVRDIEGLVAQISSPETLFILDGYHSYFALPVDLSVIGEKIFFIAGGYKYAQGGEGCCFMTLPKNCQLRPTITGWFAEMGDLENFSGTVPYSSDGYRFAGSTMDYTSLYRMHAVLDLFDQDGITIEKIHSHVQKQQLLFLQALPQLAHLGLTSNKLTWRGDLSSHGHFLTFDLGSADQCAQVHAELMKRNILTDYRKSRLRFGFSLYHEGPYSL